MISQEIKSNSMALKGLLPQVPPEQAEMIRIIRRNLAEVADMAEELERNLVVPTPEPKEAA